MLAALAARPGRLPTYGSAYTYVFAALGRGSGGVIRSGRRIGKVHLGRGDADDDGCRRGRECRHGRRGHLVRVRVRGRCRARARARVRVRGQWLGLGVRVGTVFSSPYSSLANGGEPAAAGTVAGAAALRRAGLGLFSPPRGEESGERSEGMPTRSVYLGRCGADVGEM